MVFLASALVDAVKNNYDMGIPQLVGHDIHRPVGFVFPFAVYMEPHISRMLGRGISPTNESEHNHINALHQQHILRKYKKGFELYEKDFLQLIDSQLTDQHMRIDAGCAAVYEKDVASRLFPELFEKKDDAGLIHLSILLKDFIYQGQGIFKSRNSKLSVFADVNFRRRQSIHNNFHFYFLDELIRLSDLSDITIKISIDQDLIGYAPSYHDSIELEYHWGPKFNDDVSSIRPGLTRHECNSSDRYFYGLSRTEFYWKEDENEKTFEVEELRDQTAPHDGDELYNCRYIHSIYDTDRKTFFHFDGAIRSYGLEEMSERLDKTFIEYGRKAAYKKLFRIDGSLSLANWKLLTIHYMQGNPLVYEYFGLGEERQSQRTSYKPIEKIKEILPFDIDKHSGLRLLISYQAIPNDINDGRHIEGYDVLATESETIKCIEHTVFELKKALQQLGEDIEICPNLKVLKIEDRYVNIPSIIHSGSNAEELLRTTIKAYYNLLSGMSRRGFDKEIAYTLGIIVNGQLLKVSIYGNIEAILSWSKDNLPFPTHTQQFDSWINKQRKYLEQFPENLDSPLISSLVQFDGALYVKRMPVTYPHKFSLSSKGLDFEIYYPEKEDEIFDMVQNNLIKPYSLIWIKEMVWSDTGEDYFSSARSNWLDSNTENIPISISKWEPLGLYWSKA